MLLTPARYRTMGFGADLTDIGDDELASQLSLAERQVLRHCGLPTDYDFRGGTVTDETHAWRLGNEHLRSVDRLFPDRPPLLELTAFNIWVTNTQFLDVPVARVYYDRSRNLLEPVVAATSIGVWSYSAIPVAGYREPLAKITYSYGYAFSVTDEEVYPEGGSTFRAANQWWTAADVTVKKNGTVVTDYTVNRNEGTIKFTDPTSPEIDVDVSTPLEITDVITASYTHRVPADVALAVGVVTTDLLGSRNVVSAGLLGLSAIKAEEIELRMSRDTRVTAGEISDRAKALLVTYKRLVAA